MSHKFLLNASFHKLLKAIDYEIFEEERAKGCAHCGGTLHVATYPRSPLGVPSEHREYYERRYSHCCAQCRKRSTSGSVRFFGRRWFPEPLHLLISVLMFGAVRKCCNQLKHLFGVSISKRTVKRWKQWWRSSFVNTSFWKGKGGIIPIGHLNGPFPRQLFSMYGDKRAAFSWGKAALLSLGPPFALRLVWVLQFLVPLTAGIFRSV